LVARYETYGIAAIYGGVQSEERNLIAQRFQNEDSIKILVANPAAAGTGFTLTAAHYAVYETLSWRYDYYAQSQDRNHRIGQSKPVTYVRLVADGTVEEAITQALERKQEMAGLIIGGEAIPSIIAELTPVAFKDLLATGRLAITNP
jgi:SNF2 family DNA or RNA helicase